MTTKGNQVEWIAPNIFHVGSSEAHGSHLLSDNGDIVAHQYGLKGTGRLSALLAGQGAVHTDTHDAVSRFGAIYEVVLEDHVHRARQLAHARLLGHLLQHEGLVVLVHAQAVLDLERVAVVISGRQSA